MNKPIAKPVPPPARIICEACGPIKDGKHNSLICKFVIWIKEHFGVE